MKTLFKAGVSLGVLAAVAAAGGKAEAAGFAIKEQSGNSLGQAFSNASTGTDNISHMFFNPATLAKAEGFQFVALGSYIAPTSDVSNATSPFGGPSSYNDIADNAILPAFYASAPIMHGLVVGLGVNAPFGLVTEYPENWVGSTHGIKSELSTININPAVAWQVTDMFSVGAGLRFQYADARLTNNSGPMTPTTKLKGDDWGYGFNLGVLIEPTDSLRIGVGYQSEIDQTLEGNLFGLAPVPLGAEADLTTPDMLTLGMTYDVNERWSVSAEAQYTFWSTFDELRVSSNALPFDLVTQEDWDDQIFLSVGGEYRMDDKWTFRAGVAYDETPINDTFRTPRIPGGSRYWLAVGASYEVNEWFGIDAGYTHIFVEDTEVRLNGSESVPSPGPLTADYENGIDILSVQARFSF